MLFILWLIEWFIIYFFVFKFSYDRCVIKFRFFKGGGYFIVKNNILLILIKKFNFECICIIKFGKFYGVLFNIGLY